MFFVNVAANGWTALSFKVEAGLGQPTEIRAVTATGSRTYSSTDGVAELQATNYLTYDGVTSEPTTLNVSLDLEAFDGRVSFDPNYQRSGVIETNLPIRRLEPTVTSVTRTASGDFEVKGRLVNQGPDTITGVRLLIASAPGQPALVDQELGDVAEFVEFAFVVPAAAAPSAPATLDLVTLGDYAVAGGTHRFSLDEVGGDASPTGASAFSPVRLAAAVGVVLAVGVFTYWLVVWIGDRGRRNSDTTDEQDASAQ